MGNSIKKSQPGPDFFIAEILITLCGGATLVFPDTTDVITSAEFFEQIERHGITVTGIPSSYWRELVRKFTDSRKAVLPPSLRLMIVGMETVDSETLRAWNELAPADVELLNVYGPSETTMIATFYSLRKGIPEGETLVPIGKPIPNTSAYILDQSSQPLPQESLGEICIAGAGLMRAYAGRDSQQDLPPNPNDRSSEVSRLYRTGDFGFLNSDGNLVFVGRRDGQVKIRGHRVELGTVETHLANAAGGASVVALVTRRGNQNILLGLVESGGGLSSDAIRTNLRRTVKDVLIPSTILLFEKFHRLPNGKINRQLLKEEVEQRLSTEMSQGPNSTIEGSNLEQMIGIWNLLFEVNDCSPESNFFELGGQSLMAMQVIDRVRSRFKIEITFRELFDCPTVAGLTSVVDRKSNERKASP